MHEDVARTCSSSGRRTSGAWTIPTAFFRFDVPAQNEGGDVVAVTLVVTVADAAQSGSPSTGELAVAAPFDQASLQSAQPAIVDPEIGGDFGSVAPGDVVSWPILVELVVPGQALHLAIAPVLDEGVDYWNADGAAPPRLDLVIEVSN